MKLYGCEYNRHELLKYIGDISQLGGIEAKELTEGAARGVREITVKTANGLEYAINPDCGMSISKCSFHGYPICWRSGTGVTHPAYYDPQGAGWLRSFNGGLLVTCGLSQIGAACEDEGVAYGLHGRIANTPAQVDLCRGEWVDDRYLMRFEGTVRESQALGQRLVLRRKIITWLDSAEIIVEDAITNESWYETPLLTSYHINFGFPFITENTRVDFGSGSEAATYNEASELRGLHDINGCDRPTKDFAEQIYLQKMESINGFNSFEVSNRMEDVTLRVKVSYSDTLNQLIHWRQFGQGDYVLGFEPANTTIHGRKQERSNGNVVMLSPHETVHYTLKFCFAKDC